MPTYEYRCTSCGAVVEALQKMSEAPLAHCEACGKETLRRGPGGGTGFHLQGEGWFRSGTPTPKPPDSSGGCGGSCSCHKP